MFNWQIRHIINEMAHYNCEIEVLNPLDYANYDQANQAILNKIKTNAYGLFMTCLNEKSLYIDTLKEVKKTGVPTLLFCPDNLVSPFNHEHIASYFDLVWLTSKETEYIFKKWGCNTIFQPYAANPFFLKPVESSSEIEQIGFIGTPHGSRIDGINLLLKGGIPITVHTGKGAFSAPFISASIKSYYFALKDSMRFPIGRKLAFAALIDKLNHRKLLSDSPNLTIREPIPLSDIAEYNCKYALILSFTDANSTGVLRYPVKIVNLRNFEIPMSGGLQFTRYSDELASYFEDGKEIILCKTKTEMIEKAKYYLKPEMSEIRKQIRFNARKRAERDHTWKNRFDHIFTRLGIKG